MVTYIDSEYWSEYSDSEFETILYSQYQYQLVMMYYHFKNTLLMIFFFIMSLQGAISSSGKKAKQSEHSHVSKRNAKWYSYFGKQIGSFLEVGVFA